MFDCRTLSNQSRIIELENDGQKFNWDVIGSSEVRKGEDLIELESGNILYHKGTANGRTSGVESSINKKWIHIIAGVTGTSDGIAILTLRLSKRYTIQIIQVYVHTTSLTDEEIEEFYSEVTLALDTSKNQYKYLIRDFIAKWEKRKDQKLHVGYFGLGERNDRGKRLVQYAFYLDMFIANCFFKRNPCRIWTWNLRMQLREKRQTTS